MNKIYHLEVILLFYAMKLIKNLVLILTPCEHVPTVNVGIPHCGGVDKHQRWCVEEHRLRDKHIIRWRSHHPQWPWWTFQRVGYCPSSSWSRRTNPKIWESDTTLTAYLPPSGCRIVQHNRCPPNHPVVRTTSGTSDIWQHWSNVRIWQHWSNVIEVTN